MTTEVKSEARKHPVETPPEEPHMNRLLVILYVVICLEMGVFLFLFPWISLWQQNYFVAHYSWVYVLTRNYYLRGAVSGLGLIDVYLGFYEVWRFRRPDRLIH